MVVNFYFFPFLMIQKLGVYAFASLIKAVFGIMILLIDATMISVKEDPAVALVLGLIGVFVCVWGVSYFLFYRSQWLFSTKLTQERMQKDAYKCSFLFGLFALINVLLLIANFRSKWIGLVCLGLFALMQYAIFTDPKRKEDVRA